MSTKFVLKLPDLEQSQFAVLNSLTSPSSQYCETAGKDAKMLGQSRF
jgi:hypothetical protein